MRQPLYILPQESLKIKPLAHDDRLLLQMALTQLECVSETLSEKQRDSMLKHQVRHLDKHSCGLGKALGSTKQYYIRHEDMLLCLVENGQVVKNKIKAIVHIK